MIPIPGSPIMCASIAFLLIMDCIAYILGCYIILIFILDVVVEKKEQWKLSEELLYKLSWTGARI